MIEVTPKAAQVIADHFKNKKRVPIRIFVKLGGCGIRTMSVALERPKKTDEIFEIDGNTFIVDRKLLQRIAPIKVDSDGFRLFGKGVRTSGGCGNCGYMCGVNGSGRCVGDCTLCKLPCSHGRKVRSAAQKNRSK